MKALVGPDYERWSRHLEAADHEHRVEMMKDFLERSDHDAGISDLSRLQIREPRVAELYRQVVDTIEAKHGPQIAARYIWVRDHPGANSYTYLSEDRGKTAAALQIGSEEEELVIAMSCAHELAHVIDDASGFSFSRTDTPWLRAASTSDALAEIQASKTLQERKLDWWGDGSLLVSWSDYLSQPREIFARYYEQYLIEGSDKEADFHAADVAYKERNGFHWHWHPHEFIALRPAFEELLNELG